MDCGAPLIKQRHAPTVLARKRNALGRDVERGQGAAEVEDELELTLPGAEAPVEVEALLQAARVVLVPLDGAVAAHLHALAAARNTRR
ncbi:MAG: hypothetical protein GY711_16990 [bacterium]|nr:hypothetical protein [bacterium]